MGLLSKSAYIGKEDRYMTSKTALISAMLFATAVCLFGCSSNEESQTALTESRFGLQVPGDAPQVFAPGMVSTGSYELFSAFTPDMSEYYFVRYDDQGEPYMHVLHEKNGLWITSIVGPRVGEPFISPDGSTMHLGKRFMSRTDTGWSEVEPLGSYFDDYRIMRLTASANSTFVFDQMGPPGNGGVIRYSHSVDGRQEEPKLFGLEINSGQSNAHPYISPDESYLLWDGRKDDGFGDADIYISFKQSDGSWGEGINLGGQVNTTASESYASVTPDGKYLFFNRKVSPDDVDIYWVDARLIDDLRAEL